MGKKRKKNKRGVANGLTRDTLYVLIAVILILAIVFTGLYFFAPESFNKLFGVEKLPNDNLSGDVVEVNFMDVGQGDCIIICCHDGVNIIIDAGSSAYSDSAFCERLKPEIDSMGITEFEYLLLTHSDSDHVGFTDEILKYYQVNNVYRPAFRAPSEEDNGYALVDTVRYDEFVAAAAAEPECNIRYNVGSDGVITGSGYKLELYFPDEEAYKSNSGVMTDAKRLNAASLFCKLIYGGRSVLFTGDAEGKGGNGAEDAFIGKRPIPFDCDVLKAGHHGSKYSASEEFLKHIDPEYVIVSAGKDNKYGHPDKEFLDRLMNYRDAVPDDDYNGIAQIYRTDKHGRVKLLIGSNGGMKFETAAA